MKWQWAGWVPAACAGKILLDQADREGRADPGWAREVVPAEAVLAEAVRAEVREVVAGLVAASVEVVAAVVLEEADLADAVDSAVVADPTPLARGRRDPEHSSETAPIAAISNSARRCFSRSAIRYSMRVPMR
jgi:hypothetical protein